MAKRQVDKLKKELEKDGIEFLILEEVLLRASRSLLETWMEVLHPLLNPSHFLDPV